jgi:hypothetical protein
MRQLFKRKRTFVRSIDEARTIILIDVNNLVHRAINAYRSLKTSDGRPSGYVFGCLNMIKTLTTKFGRSTPLCLVFVSDGWPAQRYALFPDYKKGRHAAGPNDAVEDSKFESLRVLHSLPGVIAYNPEAEADDVIATIARSQREHGKVVAVSSSDKDLWQLTPLGVTVFGNKGRFQNQDSATKELGFHPKRLHLYKSMYGDASDGIPGVHRLPKKVFFGSNAITPGGLFRDADSPDGTPFKKQLSIPENRQIIERNWKLTELQNVKFKAVPCGDTDGLLLYIELFECNSLRDWARDIKADQEE